MLRCRHVLVCEQPLDTKSIETTEKQANLVTTSIKVPAPPGADPMSNFMLKALLAEAAVEFAAAPPMAHTSGPALQAAHSGQFERTRRSARKQPSGSESALAIVCMWPSQESTMPSKKHCARQAVG
eukprot:CAMPEP_0177248626 /NCGR_PEP_ID=MMETSP0367-20130122/52282_1 /TAXON_ID=447022 ORGANISM="Scrippsiella hangoei-like, Strain SHHI-4" /NCGR_SAMPLE_ID=MMETSP0367 /ASSEMBLY_ACC=CAM_ASM_000362 /LENGTH=125 /DNA_ID=CAMNT_0018701003 /DNA_START=50 /DNA_END=423 /DNA_ORIENTATION=-